MKVSASKSATSPSCETKNVEILLDAAKDKVAEMVEYFVPWYTKQFERVPTAYDIQMYELGIQCDMLKAFGKYVKEDDTIVVNRVDSNKGSIVYNVTVTRDGVDTPITTEMIVAGGYNIQCRHYRYLSHTKLLSLKYNALAAAHQARMRKMTLEQKVQTERDSITRNYTTRKEEYETKMAMTDEEALANTFNGYFWDVTFEQIDEDAPIKKSYPTKEAYDAYIANDKKSSLARFRDRWSAKELKYYTKSYEKDMKRLDNKLEKGLAKLAL